MDVSMPFLLKFAFQSLENALQACLLAFSEEKSSPVKKGLYIKRDEVTTKNVRECLVPFF